MHWKSVVFYWKFKRQNGINKVHWTLNDFYMLFMIFPISCIHSSSFIMNNRLKCTISRANFILFVIMNFQLKIYFFDFYKKREKNIEFVFTANCMNEVHKLNAITYCVAYWKKKYSRFLCLLLSNSRNKLNEVVNQPGSVTIKYPVTTYNNADAFTSSLSNTLFSPAVTILYTVRHSSKLFFLL